METENIPFTVSFSVSGLSHSTSPPTRSNAVMTSLMTWRMEGPQLPVRFDVAVVPTGRVVDQPVGTNERAEPRLVGRCGGHSLSLINERARQLAVLREQRM